MLRLVSGDNNKVYKHTDHQHARSTSVIFSFIVSVTFVAPVWHSAPRFLNPSFNFLRPCDFKTTLRLTLLENRQLGTGLELDPLHGDRKRKGEGRLVEPGREQVHVASNVCVPLRVGLILF